MSFGFLSFYSLLQFGPLKQNKKAEVAARQPKKKTEEAGKVLHIQ